MIDEDPTEELTFFKKVKYLILIAAYSVAYFLYAIFGGAYEWIKNKLK
tara:strand:+ start:29 stop:172 length:144 start_codon:yes stop_codon:yes gene_type:complete